MKRIIINSNIQIQAKTIKIESILKESGKLEDIFTIEHSYDLDSEIDDILKNTKTDLIIINMIGGDFNTNVYQKEVIEKCLKFNMDHDAEHPKVLFENIFNNKVTWKNIATDLPELSESWYDFPNTNREKKIGNKNIRQDDTFPYMPRFNTQSSEDKIIHGIIKLSDLREEYINCYPGTEFESYD